MEHAASAARPISRSDALYLDRFVSIVGSSPLPGHWCRDGRTLRGARPGSGERSHRRRVTDVTRLRRWADVHAFDSCVAYVGCENRLQTPTAFCDDGDACTDDDYENYPAS